MSWVEYETLCAFSITFFKLLGIYISINVNLNRTCFFLSYIYSFIHVTQQAFSLKDVVYLCIIICPATLVMANGYLQFDLYLIFV